MAFRRLTPGDRVIVDRRTGPNLNLLGGCGVITKVHRPPHTGVVYDVSYAAEGTVERSVLPGSILGFWKDTGKRSRRPADRF